MITSQLLHDFVKNSFPISSINDLRAQAQIISVLTSQLIRTSVAPILRLPRRTPADRMHVLCTSGAHRAANGCYISKLISKVLILVTTRSRCFIFDPAEKRLVCLFY